MKVKTIFLLTILILLSILSIANAQTFNYVLDTCLTGDCSPPIYPVPNIERPAKGASIIDPNFQTTVTRISEKDVDQISRRLTMNTYCTVDPVNADGSKLMLYSGGFHVYDANTFEVLIHLSIGDGGQIPRRQDIEPRWDDEDPNIFYYVLDKTFNKYDISTKTSTLVRDFQNDFSEGALVFTATKGNASMDRKYWTFSLKTGSAPFRIIKVFTYDLENNQIISTMDIPDSLTVRYTTTSPNGDRAIVHYWWPAQVTSYDLNFEDPIEIGTLSHADYGFTTDGRQVRIFFDPSSDSFAMIDINTGVRTTLLNAPLTGSWDTEPAGYHFSALNYDTPGWALVSTYGTTENASDNWVHNLLFMLELKENPRIWILAHTHSPLETNANKDYWAEAFASTTKSGKKIFWGSNWDNPGSETLIDAYQVILPENWWSDLSDNSATSVTIETESPNNFALYQNYPNPFNPTTNISFTLPSDSNVRLTILNVLGQEIFELINENKKVGFHNYTFDASSLSSGIYFYRIATENFVKTKQMILMK